MGWSPTEIIGRHCDAPGVNGPLQDPQLLSTSDRLQLQYQIAPHHRLALSQLCGGTSPSPYRDGMAHRGHYCTARAQRGHKQSAQ